MTMSEYLSVPPKTGVKMNPSADELFNIENDTSMTTVITKLYTDGCEPCEKQGEILAELADEYSVMINNVNLQDDESRPYKEQYEITEVPTTIVQTSQDVVVFSGLQPKSAFERVIPE